MNRYTTTAGRTIVSLFCLISLFLGCSSPTTRLSHCWFFTANYTVDGVSSDTAVIDEVLTPASFLNLKSNGEFTAYFSHFLKGKWHADDREIILENANWRKKLPILRSDNKELLVRGKTRKGPINFAFESLPAHFSNEAEDPFSLLNNLWRNKPGHPETDAELYDRLRNHFQFWEKYFQWGSNDQITVLDVRSTPTLIKIYGNGFTLKSAQDLPAEWRNCFYNDTDCFRASQLMEQYIKTYQIAWPHTSNKYVFFLSAFQQLKDHLPS